MTKKDHCGVICDVTKKMQSSSREHRLANGRPDGSGVDWPATAIVWAASEAPRTASIAALPAPDTPRIVQRTGLVSALTCARAPVRSRCALGRQRSAVTSQSAGGGAGSAGCHRQPPDSRARRVPAAASSAHRGTCGGALEVKKSCPRVAARAPDGRLATSAAQWAGHC